MRHDTSHTERIARTTFLNIWIGIGVIIIGGVVLDLIGSLSSVLLFLSVGAISAFVASPIVNWLERHRVPRGAGALAGLIVVIVGLVLLFASRAGPARSLASSWSSWGSSCCSPS